jgi:hypothetical protein
MVKVTEASIAFKVSKKPKVPINKHVPFLVNSTGERVVWRNADTIPEWMFTIKPDIIRFVYRLECQDIPCLFTDNNSMLILQNIRYQNLEDVRNEVSNLLELLEVEQTENAICTYKAVATYSMHKEWDKDAIADIITNDSKVFDVMAISEKLCTLGERRLFPISVLTKDDTIVKVNLKPEFTGVVISMSRLSSVEMADEVYGYIRFMLGLYSTEIPAYMTPRRLRGIKFLRNELPELFIHNYTRECPILPIMVSEEEAKQLQHVIFYPKEGPLSRYYTAEAGYYVGLKKNRLSNNDMFPYLVTCYLQDHMARKNSDTYTYYVGTEEQVKKTVARPIPKSMGRDYKRIKATSFVDALETALNTIIDTSWECPQVVKQEMYDVHDDEIVASIRNKTCDSRTYRYFEELLKISIHVVDHVPKAYIWELPYERHVIVFENVKKTYGMTRWYYDVLIRNRDGAMVLESNDPMVTSIVEQKRSLSIPPPIIDGAILQFLDSMGRCTMVVMEDGDEVNTLSRPLTVPVVKDDYCFFHHHVMKLNIIRKQLGIQTVDHYKQSAGNILYFPNDESFTYWNSIRKKA